MLAVTMVLLALLMVLIAGFASLASIEMATTRSDLRSFQGFYAAEAGLNARADSFRQLFVNAALPSGASPASGGGAVPCTGTNQGTGQFACGSYSFQGRNVQTWVAESPLSTDAIVIPRGEDFQNLFGKEYHFIVYSEARNQDNAREASLEMHFKSRTVPLFQFSAFYNKDLEIVTTPSWLLTGPVHTNSDLYLGCDGTLDIGGQVTVVGNLYRGRKDANSCMTGAARVPNPSTPTALPSCSGGQSTVAQSSLAPWNGMVSTISEPVSVPSPAILDPLPGRPYWNGANVRIVLNLHGGTPAIEVRDKDGAVDAVATGKLALSGAANVTSSFYDQREGGTIQMLELDLGALLLSPHLSSIFALNLNSTPSLAPVLYLTVDADDADEVNHYGVRLRNAAEIPAILTAGPTNLLGLTVVTDQAAYIRGNYNATNKKPAAVLADTVHVLSNNWNDGNSTLSLASRVPTATTVNAAILAGTDRTGNAEGTDGQDLGAYNGGLEDMLRLHENWNGTVTLTYSGSFVSLGAPRRAAGAWALGGTRYTAPIRAFSFDTDFEDPETLPPMTPQFVYLRQELFVRRFEL